jgi:hypothetical protein
LLLTSTAAAIASAHGNIAVRLLIVLAGAAT